MASTPKDVVNLTRENNIKMIDFKFIDLPGIWQHYSIPAHRMSEELFEEGIGFDGSSIRGFAQIQESDMLVFPDPESAFIDPLLEVPTLSLTCYVRDPLTMEPFSRDPRYIAYKAEKYLVSSESVRSPIGVPKRNFTFSTTYGLIRVLITGYYYIDSRRESGTRVRTKNEPGLPAAAQGRILSRATDGHFQDLRSNIMLTMDQVGIEERFTTTSSDGRTGRNRYEVRFARPDGGQGDALQVCRQERLPESRLSASFMRSLCSRTMAPECTSTCRFGRRARICSMMNADMRA